MPASILSNVSASSSGRARLPCSLIARVSASCYIHDTSGHTFVTVHNLGMELCPAGRNTKNTALPDYSICFIPKLFHLFVYIVAENGTHLRVIYEHGRWTFR
jgi:hypothetical protein